MDHHVVRASADLLLQIKAKSPSSKIQGVGEIIRRDMAGDREE